MSTKTHTFKTIQSDRRSLRQEIVFLSLFFIVLLFDPAKGLGESNKKSSENELIGLSIEDLMELEIVSVSNIGEKIWDTPSNITVVTKQQISEWGVSDLKDVLRRTAGYNVVADRDEWSFSSRGSVSDNNLKYLILIDGHRMYSIDNFGPGNIHEMPMDLGNVERIEIIRGPGSVVWGSAALAGVINIITKTPTDLGEYDTWVSGTLGEDHTYKTNFQTRRIYEDMDMEWILMGSYAQSDGSTVVQSSATADADNTPESPPTGGFPILDTSTGFSSHPFGTYRTELGRNDGGHMVHFRGRYENFHLNLFSFYNSIFNRHYESLQGRENYLTNEKYFVETIYEDNLGLWDFTFKTSFGYNNMQYDNETGLPIKLEKIWKDKNANTGIVLSREFSDKFRFNSGLEYTYTRTGPDDSSTTNISGDTTYVSGPSFEDHDLFGYLLMDYELTDDVTFSGGTGISFNDGRGNKQWLYSPRAGMIWHSSDETAHKFLYNRAFLRPATFQAGDNVNSEIMDQFEYIWLQKFDKATLSTTLYWQRLKGFINIVTLGATGSSFANAGDYTSKGIEVEFAAPLGNNHNFWANASCGDAEAENFPSTLPVNSRRVDPQGNLLSYPNFTFNTGATFRFMDRKLFLSPALRFVDSAKYRAEPPTAGDTTLTSATYAETDAFTYLDLNIGYEPADNLGIYLTFFNLTDIREDNHLSIWNGTISQTGRYIEFKLVYKF